MSKFVEMLFLTVITVFILPLSLSKEDFDEYELIASINRNQSSWEAGRNWDDNVTSDLYDSLSGTIDESGEMTDEIVKELKTTSPDEEELPPNFDASEKWPYCHSIKEARQQGKCGGCWAVASAAAITDRICIASKGSVKKHISSEDLLECCSNCYSKKNGCYGGKVSKAWKYWNKHGIVSGGEYLSEEGCKPYSEGAFKNREVAKCKYACSNAKYKTKYKDDKNFGGKHVIFYKASIRTIQSEIFRNGPVISGLKVYKDLKYYRKGVYFHQYGAYTEELHAVKIIGWGVEDEQPYWLVVNSWGKKWGDNGMFKIRRGHDECRIERLMFARGNSTYLFKTTAFRTFVFVNVLASIHKLEGFLFCC